MYQQNFYMGLVHLQEKENIARLPHNIIMENRKLLTISGVNDVDSFDEELIVLFTELGQLSIKGKNLHISQLNVDTGELNMTGEIIALFYNDEQPKGKGTFISRVFK